MGRIRTARVRQQLRTLERLALRYRGTAAEKPVAFLLALRTHPERSHRQIAAEIGVSKPTVDRWWRVYREQGLDALLEWRRSASTVGDAARERLRAWLSAGPEPSVAEVRVWMSEKLGMEYSDSGIRSLLRRLGYRPRSTAAHDHRWSALADASDRSGTLSSGGLVELIASLPESCDMFETIKAFSDGLSKVLPGVDRVVVSVDTQSDLLDPDGYDPRLIALQDANRSGSARGRRRIALRLAEPMGEVVLDDMKRRGYPLDEYHRPTFVDYHYREKAYLGSVFLFRLLENPPISSETIAALEALEPIIRYVLADIVVRHDYIHPRERTYYDAVRRMTDDAHLTPQERRVVHYRLLGLAYEKIADELAITESTVKKHVRSVHAKTGTRSFRELVAKYLTPPTLPE